MSRRIVIMGNAGSGKTSLARRLAAEHRLPALNQDDIAFGEQAVRRPLEESLRLQHDFIAQHEHGWIIEGCYGDLIQTALPHCTELIFLNPGVDACVDNCRKRPWEPGKFPDRAAQDAMLEGLIAWVREYPTRRDEYGASRHRAVFDSFAGMKREVTNQPDPARA